MAVINPGDGRYVRSHDKRNQLRKDNPMFQYQIAQIIHKERQREIELRLMRRAALAERSVPVRPARSIRQRIGRGVVKLGVAIAADGARSARIVRDPCGSIGELAARR